MIVLREGDFWITLDEQLTLMHRIWRPEIRAYGEIAVGEAFVNDSGVWEVRVSERKGQRMVRITDSPEKALEVLWEQRITMHWGYYQ